MSTMKKWFLVNFADGHIIESSEYMYRGELEAYLSNRDNLSEFTWFNSKAEFIGLRDGDNPMEFRVNYKDTSFRVKVMERDTTLFQCTDGSVTCVREGLTNSIQKYGESQIDLRNRLRGTK